MPPNVRFFAGFTLSLAFRYSVIFIVRLKKSQSTPPLFGLSSFLYLSFRDCGCGKAMSFDDFFRKDRHDPLIFLSSDGRGETRRIAQVPGASAERLGRVNGRGDLEDGEGKLGPLLDPLWNREISRGDSAGLGHKAFMVQYGPGP